MASVSDHRVVQAVAKGVLADLGPTIVATDTERSIATRATAMLSERGLSETWYYNCPAFVLLGSRSCLSLSGRSYEPSEETVGVTNLVTVDLSPMRNGVWGDCARSFCIENGTWAAVPSSRAFAQGAQVEKTLHEAMQAFVTPRTSFEELFRFANAEIQRLGFENLDFLGNVGHSIESTREARRYIEQGNLQLLGDVGLFTFEPHVRRSGETWGFKHENIYYFTGEGRAVEL
jgi:hypothetical protein